MHPSRHGVRFGVMAVVFAFMASTGSRAVSAQQKPSLVPVPKVLSLAQTGNLSSFDNQLIRLPDAQVIHADTAQVFMVGEKSHPVHVVVPAPATDMARVGDVVELTGIVRRYNSKEFERDYHWFRETDYPDVHAGDWVVVATSVENQEGTQLVPGSTISSLPPNAPPTRPGSKK